MGFETITFDVKNSVANITLNRPEVLNAWNTVMAQELSTAISSCARDESVRVVLVKGAGRSFSAGGDVQEFRRVLDGEPYRYFKEVTSAVHECILRVRELPKPVIAAVHGAVAGGGYGFMLACDLILAGESAKFTTAFLNIAASPDSSSSFFLPRMVGVHKAAELFLLSPILRAREALSLGIVNRVVPDEQLPQAAEEWASRLAAGPSAAIARTKMLLNQTYNRDLATQLALESEFISPCALTKDMREGVNAFLEKRRPVFTGE